MEKLKANYVDMKKAEKQLSFIRNANKAVSFDLGSLRKERENLEEDNK